MKIRILAVGQKMPKWVEQTYNDYNKRLQKNQQIELVEISPIHRGKSISSNKAKTLEGKKILAALHPQEKIIVLDEYGKLVSTKQVAESIKKWQMNSIDIAIVIGGADGISQEVKSCAYTTWSLSLLTFPHPLVRVILIEQIYRAYSIIANHPYHRE